jgi:ABC-type Na+ efflux pump permease subunit
MSDHVIIYLIVALNTGCQLMLVWRQKFPAGARNRYCLCAVAIPLFLMFSMRLLIAGGMIHVRVADQSHLEHFVTTVSSMLLVAGPWFVTVAAVVNKRRKRAVIRTQTA